MTTNNAHHLENLRSIREELFQILEGMDYCLDWKADADTWSVKEVICHLLDTPPSGVPGVLEGILSGEIAEFDLWADQSNISPEKLAWDIDEVKAQLNGYFQRLEDALGAAAGVDLASKQIMVHQRNRHWDEPRPVEWLVERLFAGHWREHLVQLREIRETLGV
ncbi:MAG: hypothetical protein ACE5Q6_02975 [Dehalococcoidia bacterium]